MEDNYLIYQPRRESRSTKEFLKRSVRVKLSKARGQYYKYKEGSLIEYAIRKEKLLLDMDKDISPKTLILLIAAGLPEAVRNKIDKENCKNSTELLHEIRKCENLENKNSFKKRKKTNMTTRRDLKENSHVRIVKA